ncbi:CpaD family pilus assembly protein [Sphingobium sp. BYY-5]|uniref:CpaD family pilus assembly protein n=1 Tax=Sphingobium sp. BYY-5 TaxID=2926400 RepID=UPI001FA74D31|nr:CpaD family pilus assembly protein [Sphingobium sp. BYY-5]MCI4588764.1 CpaD family pilus assembly protein [Sphingobium sp. BYY-5]
MTSQIPLRLSSLSLGALAVLSLSLAGCVTDSQNRSVESIHQPMVRYASYTFDVQAGADDRLAPVEARRLDDWFASIRLGYGDQVAIVSDGYHGSALRDGIAAVVARHGLLVGEDSSAVAGAAPQGAIRLIVRRASANISGCPDWSAKQETETNLGTSSNFGCGVNGNLAAMVANPEDLVRGQSTDSDLRTATSNRAISTYRDKAPTGAGDLKQIKAGAQ